MNQEVAKRQTGVIVFLQNTKIDFCHSRYFVCSLGHFEHRGSHFSLKIGRFQVIDTF